MDVGNQGTKLRITNISEDVSELHLLLYLEKILQCHVVDVSHSQGNPDATVTVRGPGIDISTVQSAADEVPLSNQVVTISVLEEDASLEGVGDGDLRAVGSSELTADEEERSWWSPQAATNYGVTGEGDTPTSTNEAGPMDFETESTSALGAARNSSTDAAEDAVGSFSGKSVALSEVDFALTEEHNTRTEKAVTTKTAPAMKSGKKNIKRAKPKKQRETIAIPPEKWKLMLCLLKIKMEEDDSFKFHVDEKTHSVYVENVNDVLEVYDIMAVIFEVCMREISPRLAELLSSKKGEEVLENSNIHATFFVREEDVFLVTDSEDTETLLRELIKKEEMPLLDVHEPYLQSQKWSDVRKDLSEKYLVDFAVEERKILMKGVHTELASRELGNELSRNATTKESLKFKPGEGRYIKERGDHSLDTVRSKRNVEINLKKSEAGKPWEVEISGHVSNVKTAREEIKKLFETLDEDTKDYTDAGARAFFGSTNTKRSLKGIEGEERSIIEVEDGKASGVPFLLSSSEASNWMSLDSLRSVFGCGRGSGRDDHHGSAPIVRPKDRLRRKPRRQLKAAPPKPNEDHLLLTTGGVSLYLSYGDVTGYKAGVLVNTPVAECASFARGGAVANAFLKKGGQELEQAYFNQRGQSSDERDDIICTPACGQLQSVCSHVFHMRLRKWSRRTERSRGTQSKLQFYIKNCLRRCVNDYGATSIAFPTVGCGQFHYPVDKVANAFEYVLKAFAVDGHTMKVTLVAFDEDIYDKVLDYFEPRRPRRPRVSLVDSDQSSDEESDQEGQGEEEVEEEVEEDNVEDAATEGAEDQHLRKIMVPAHAGVRLRVYGACKDSIRKTFEKVDDLISNSIVEEDIKHPDMKNLPLSTLQKLGSLNSEELAVTVDQSKGVVRLAGMSKSVSITRASINMLLQEAGWDHLPANQKRLLRLADDKVPVPNSWTKCIPKKDKKGKPKIPEASRVDVSPKLHNAVETLALNTWKKDVVGHGRDAAGLNHSSIKITKVHRVENYSAWQTYNSKRKEYFRKAALDSQLFPTGLDGESDVLTRTFKLQELDKLIEPEINEVFLFHGTKKENLKAITKQGLDFRVGKEGEKHAMFGKGVYFAESSTKADQYADEKPARSGGEHHMILARVILGNPFICHKPDKMPRPPCTNCQSPECKEHGAFYDSVIGIKGNGNRPLLFREFIVYDTGMCYPEFVITYERQ